MLIWKKKNITNTSASALSQKRGRIDVKYFYEFNDCLRNYVYKNKKESRLIGVDGSQINLLLKLNENDYKTANNEKYSSGLVSALYDIDNEMPIDMSLFKHSNEREALISQFKYISEKDILIMDRGYYSEDFLKILSERNQKFIFRLRKNLKILDKFKKKPNSNQITANVNGIKMKVVKFVIRTPEDKNEIYYIGTNIYNKSVEYFKDTYWKRWKTETNFKQAKHYLSLFQLKSKTENKMLQDIAIHTSILMINSFIQNQLNSEFVGEKINSKNSIYMLLNSVLYLFLYKKLTKKILNKLLKIFEIIKNTRVSIIPNRHSERIKVRPSTKWCFSGNKFGNGLAKKS